MRRTGQAGLFLGSWLLVTGPLEAGLYDPARPVAEPGTAQGEIKALPFALFRDVLSDLLGVAVEQPASPLRQEYVKRRDAVLNKPADGWTVEDRVSLSACLMRLGDYERAVEVLERVADRGQRNFMVFANLGTAHQLAGRPDRARSFLEMSLDVWPAEWPGWTKAQLDWYRRAEKNQLRLLILRMGEPGGRLRPPEAVDNLFGVRFVGESGQFEPGTLAAQEKEKLPKDAEGQVQQLLIWLPQDTRLRDQGKR